MQVAFSVSACEYNTISGTGIRGVTLTEVKIDAAVDLLDIGKVNQRATIAPTRAHKRVWKVGAGASIYRQQHRQQIIT